MPLTTVAPLQQAPGGSPATEGAGARRSPDSRAGGDGTETPADADSSGKLSEGTRTTAECTRTVYATGQHHQCTGGYSWLLGNQDG